MYVTQKVLHTKCSGGGGGNSVAAASLAAFLPKFICAISGSSVARLGDHKPAAVDQEKAQWVLEKISAVFFLISC